MIDLKDIKSITTLSKELKAIKQDGVVIWQGGIELTFDGTYEMFGSFDSDWAFWIKSDGTLTVSGEQDGGCDIFLVGPGGNGGGASGHFYNNAAYGGKGGNGGQIVNDTAVAITEGTYSCKVNASDSTSIGALYSATKGGGKEGGNGCDAWGGYGSSAQDGVNGELAFGDGIDEATESSGTYFGASGGGGGGQCNVMHWDGRSGIGGTTGAGNGGLKSGTSGGNATPNTGSGAGGGGADAVYENYAGGGTGATGIIIIRNHREPIDNGGSE